MLPSPSIWAPPRKKESVGTCATQPKRARAAIGEKIVLLRPKDRDAQRFAPGPFVLRADEHRARSGDWRRRADRDVTQSIEQPRYARDQCFLSCCCDHAAARARWRKPSM